MLVRNNYYTTKDLLSLGRDVLSGDIETLCELFGYENALKDQWSAIAKLFLDFLTRDNHFVVKSPLDSMEDASLPINDASYDNMELVDNGDIQTFYESFFLWLTETAPIYADRIAVYEELVTKRLDKPSSSAGTVVGLSNMPITASFDSAPDTDTLSTLTQTTTETTAEATTPLERYEQAMNSIRSINKEWYDDFVRRFALYE